MDFAPWPGLLFMIIAVIPLFTSIQHFQHANVLIVLKAGVITFFAGFFDCFGFAPLRYCVFFLYLVCLKVS